MKFIDFHTHHYPTLKANNILANYNIDLAEKQANILQIVSQKNVCYSIGLHPWFLKKLFFEEREYGIFSLLENTIKANKNNIIALGEMGLDKHIINDFSLSMQNSLFQKQIHLAKALNMPLILHTVNAFNETLQVLKAEKFTNAVAFHGFNKKVSIAKMLWQQHYFTSFGAAIFHSKTAQESLIQCPINLLFLETDAQIEFDIIKIYEKAASLRHITLCSLQEQIEENYNRFCTTI